MKLQTLCDEVGASPRPVGPAARNRAGGQRPVALVLSVENGGLLDPLGRRFGAEINQARLGRQIVLPGGVIVEVVATHIGEGGDVELTGPDPVLNQGVGGGLDDRILDARVHHPV